MKAATITFITALCLAGCHADRTEKAPSAEHAADSSTASAKTDKSFEEARDSMLGKNTDIESQHWATNPAASSTATTPASALDKPASSGTSSPAAASSVIKAR